MTYESPDNGYYEVSRAELLRLHAWRGGERVLDIGCGAGANADFLRSVGAGTLTGIEILPDMANQAEKKFDQVFCGAVEDLLFEVDPGQDVVIAGDVLEHLVRPSEILSDLHRITHCNSTLLVSVPNVRHISVLRMLALRGAWSYQDSGIMDATHLRWFTKSSAVAMLEDTGWRVIQSAAKFNTIRQRAWHARTLGACDEFLAEQFMFVCVPER